MRSHVDRKVPLRFGVRSTAWLRPRWRGRTVEFPLIRSLRPARPRRCADALGPCILHGHLHEWEHMARPGLILKLSCPDQSGIVAKIASYIAGHRGNLVEFAQFTDKLAGRFFARLEIDTGELDVDTDDFVEGFGTLGRSLRAEWHFRRLPYKMRTAVLVTKTDHCLNEILWRAGIGELPVEITSIIGNRDTCRHIAEQAGI